MLRILVCDDDKEFRQRLMQMIRIWSDHSGIPTELYPFDNGDELISKNAAFRMDIILLDIVMPLLNGMDTARELRAQDTAVKIIFLTSSPEFALESYEVRAQDYLLKPITYERLRRALEDCSHLFEAEPKNMVLKTSFGFQKLCKVIVCSRKEFNQDLTYNTNTRLLLITDRDGIEIVNHFPAHFLKLAVADTASA